MPSPTVSPPLPPVRLLCFQQSFGAPSMKQQGVSRLILPPTPGSSGSLPAGTPHPTPSVYSPGSSTRTSIPAPAEGCLCSPGVGTPGIPSLSTCREEAARFRACAGILAAPGTSKSESFICALGYREHRQSTFLSWREGRSCGNLESLSMQRSRTCLQTINLFCK